MRSTSDSALCHYKFHDIVGCTLQKSTNNLHKTLPTVPTGWVHQELYTTQHQHHTYAFNFRFITKNFTTSKDAHSRNQQIISKGALQTLLKAGWPTALHCPRWSWVDTYDVCVGCSLTTNFSTSEDAHPRNQQKIGKEEGPKKESSKDSLLRVPASSDPKLLKPQSEVNLGGAIQINWEHP